jgi:hypothetical protein
VIYFAKLIYWRIAMRLFPEYTRRSIQRDIDQMADIFFRVSPVQKRLREQARSDGNDPDFLYPIARPTGIKETPREQC